MDNTKFDNRDKCPACQSNNLKQLFCSPFNDSPIREYLETFYNNQGGVDFDFLEGSSFNVVECLSCELIFQNEVLNNEGMKLLYDEWIDPDKVKNSYNNTNFGLYSTHASEILMLITYINKPTFNLKFLDFGMGWAQWAMVAKGFGIDSWGAELSIERKEHAANQGIRVVEYDDIPYHKFDFINTEQVFEHVPDPLELLIHLSKSLNEHGILKISVPTMAKTGNRLKKLNRKCLKGNKKIIITPIYINSIAPLEHINYFSRYSITKMAEIAGLKEIFIPLRLQYRYKSNWSGMKPIAKNILSPLLYNIFRNRNYLFFTLNANK